MPIVHFHREFDPLFIDEGHDIGSPFLEFYGDSDNRWIGRCSLSAAVFRLPTLGHFLPTYAMALDKTKILLTNFSSTTILQLINLITRCETVCTKKTAEELMELLYYLGGDKLIDVEEKEVTVKSVEKGGQIHITLFFYIRMKFIRRMGIYSSIPQGGEGE